MGEIADAMLDGTLCEGCGSYIEGEGSGFPRYCSAQCAKDRGADFSADDRYAPRVPRFNRNSIKPTAKANKPPRAADPLILHGGKMACPYCARPVKIAGLGNHVLASHRDQLEAKK
jgi:hypothetical protein